MNIHKLPSGVARAKTLRRPVTDEELDRLFDSYAFKGEATEEDKQKAREGKLYSMMRKAATDFYRLGEKGARPRPKLIVE